MREEGERGGAGGPIIKFGGAGSSAEWSRPGAGRGSFAARRRRWMPLMYLEITGAPLFPKCWPKFESRLKSVWFSFVRGRATQSPCRLAKKMPCSRLFSFSLCIVIQCRATPRLYLLWKHGNLGYVDLSILHGALHRVAFEHRAEAWHMRCPL